MTSRQLTSMGRRFMRRLGMHEWIPEAKFTVVRGLKNEDGDALVGQSEWNPEERKCTIEVAPDEPDAMVETLIHEIVHVLLEGHIGPLKTDKYDSGYELGINRLSKTLWGLWRDR